MSHWNNPWGFPPPPQGYGPPPPGYPTPVYVPVPGGTDVDKVLRFVERMAYRAERDKAKKDEPKKDEKKKDEVKLQMFTAGQTFTILMGFGWIIGTVEVAFIYMLLKAVGIVH